MASNVTASKRFSALAVPSWLPRFVAANPARALRSRRNREEQARREEGRNPVRRGFLTSLIEPPRANPCLKGRLSKLISVNIEIMLEAGSSFRYFLKRDKRDAAVAQDIGLDALGLLVEAGPNVTGR